MTKAKHTPGPWSLHGDRSLLVGVYDGRCMVATVNAEHIVERFSRPLAEAQANARLIAAAPALLKALRMQSCVQCLDSEPDAVVCDSCRAKRAALRDAEGEA